MIGRSRKEEEIEDLSDQEVDPGIEAKAGIHESYTPTQNFQLSKVFLGHQTNPFIIFPHA